MTASAQAAGERGEPILEGESPLILRAIRLTGCGATIWRRQFDPDFQSWLEALPPDRLPSVRVALPLDRVKDAVQCACEQAALRDSPERAALVDDIASLARLFAGVMGNDLLHLRVDPVSSDSCRRFHVDYVSARMLCTYRGQATQYGLRREDHLSMQIRTLQTGDVGLFRGRLWPTSGESEVVHRSPPLGDSGETRLLLAIDEG